MEKVKSETKKELPSKIFVVTKELVYQDRIFLPGDIIKIEDEKELNLLSDKIKRPKKFTKELKDKYTKYG